MDSNTTYEEFENKVRDVIISVHKPQICVRDNKAKVGYKYIPDTKFDINTYLTLKWEIGGARGGNCWGDDACQYTSYTEEPDFTLLDSILEAIVPDISFLKYKSIVSQVIIRKSGTDMEYYGNYTDYKTKTLDLQKLYYLLFGDQ
jgi:hypothetical protein